MTHWLKKKSFDKQKKVEAVTRIYDSLNVPRITEKKIHHFFEKGFAQLDNINSSHKDELIRFAKNLIDRQM